MPLGPLVVRRRGISLVMGTLQGALSSVFLGVTIIVFNGLQMMSLVLRPFSHEAFRRFNSWAADTWWGLCVLLAEYFYGTRLVLTGDAVPRDENTVIILNHQSMTDIPVVLAFAKSKGRLGDLKWFVKDVVKYVPGIGWGMLFLDCLFIKRDWTEDRAYVLRVFQKILRQSIPMWLVSFVEGTRVRPPKLAQSRTYAQESGLRPPEHVLIPRTKGFVASVRSLHGHADAVYDLTIGYVEGVPTIWQWIRGDVRRVHVHVRRFPIAGLPPDDDGLSRWLIRVFEEKDGLLTGYYERGSFQEP